LVTRENNNNVIILISRATFNDGGGGRNAPLSAVRLLTTAAAYVDVRRRSFRSGGGGGGGGTKNAATELIIAAAAPTDRPTSTAGAHFRNAPVTSFFSFSPHTHGGGTLSRHGRRQLSMFTRLSGIPRPAALRVAVRQSSVTMFDCSTSRRPAHSASAAALSSWPDNRNRVRGVEGQEKLSPIVVSIPRTHARTRPPQ